MVNGIRLPDTLLNEQECENEKRKMAFALSTFPANVIFPKQSRHKGKYLS